MEITNIHEAKTHLSRLIERAYQGEEIIICRSGKPMAKLVKYVTSAQQRIPGQWKGQVRVASDFDILPETLSALLRGEDETSS